MKSALVLEGGAMRGLFTAGVIDVLMENGIDFDGAIGVSAGACFGCNIKSKQRGRVLRYSLRFCKDEKYCSFRSLIKTGNLYNAEYSYHTVPNELDIFDTETFQKNPMEFYVVATDANTGQPLYHRCVDGKENDLGWIQASSAIPVFAKAVLIDGYTMYDGGIADPIPYAKMRELGYKKEVLVLTQPKEYRKKPQKYMNVLKRLLYKYPALLQRMENRYQAYNQTLDAIQKEEQARNIFVIRPPKPLNIGSVCHDPEELKRVYYMGRFEAVKQLKALKEFMQKEL